MGDVGVLALRGLAGVFWVVVFALIGEVVVPKAFSGLFSAAPSVVIASLAITVMSESASKARVDCVGIVVGSVGMCVCCGLAAVAIPRLRALWMLGGGVAGLGPPRLWSQVSWRAFEAHPAGIANWRH